VSQISKLLLKILFTNKHFRSTLENIQTSNGLVAHHLENEAQSAISTGSTEQSNGDEEKLDFDEETDEGDADDDDVGSTEKKKALISSTHTTSNRISKLLWSQLLVRSIFEILMRPTEVAFQ
jgi:hypothetical protein